MVEPTACTRRERKYGVSFGSALTIAISYTTNHSLLWAVVHGVFSRLDIIYSALVRA
jgi:hypothetical protein